MQRLRASESIQVRRGLLPVECGTLTFNSENAQVVDARFVDEVIWVHEPVQGGDLAKIEQEPKHIVVQLTSLRAFRSSSKHRVRTLSVEPVDAEEAPVDL